MRIDVRDARAEPSGATVGFKRNGYGVEQPSGRQVWMDVVRGGYEKTALQFVTEGDYQDVVDRLHTNPMSNLRAALPAAATLTAPR